SRIADMPAVIIQCVELIIFGDTDRVHVAANWLFPGNLSVQISLLDSAFQNSTSVIQCIGTFTVVPYGRGAFITIFVNHPCSLLGYHLPTLLSDIILDNRKNIFDDFSFLILQRRTRIPLYTAGPFAGL